MMAHALDRKYKAHDLGDLADLGLSPALWP